MPQKPKAKYYFFTRRKVHDFATEFIGCSKGTLVSPYEIFNTVDIYVKENSAETRGFNREIIIFGKLDIFFQNIFRIKKYCENLPDNYIYPISIRWSSLLNYMKYCHFSEQIDLLLKETIKKLPEETIQLSECPVCFLLCKLVSVKCHPTYSICSKCYDRCCIKKSATSSETINPLWTRPQYTCVICRANTTKIDNLLLPSRRLQLS